MKKTDLMYARQKMRKVVIKELLIQKKYEENKTDYELEMIDSEKNTYYCWTKKQFYFHGFWIIDSRALALLEDGDGKMKNISIEGVKFIS